MKYQDQQHYILRKKMNLINIGIKENVFDNFKTINKIKENMIGLLIIFFVCDISKLTTKEKIYGEINGEENKRGS